MKKRCGTCGRRKPLSAYSVKVKATGQRHSKCRECYNDYRRQWRERSPEAMDKHKRWMEAQRRALAEKVSAFKAANPCVDCKRRLNPWQMQFDHVSEDKDKEISRLVGNGAAKKVWNEIQKCELVCANCHADRTHLRRHAGVM